MDSYTEFQCLEQRRDELRSITSELEDIKDWMSKNAGEMQSGLLECITELDAVIFKVDAIRSAVAEKAEAMEKVAYEQKDD